jgi:Fe-S-cluster-containing hydrogenase component 2
MIPEEEKVNFQIMIDLEKCTGCGICEMVCSLYHIKECNPEKSKIRVIRHPIEGITYSVPMVCQQCEKPLCKSVCPKGAILRDIKTNALVVDEKRCIGCKFCFNACPFGGISINTKDGIATKCNLCGGEPKCVEFCPTGALSFVRLDKMSIWKKRKGFDRYLESLKSETTTLFKEGKG